MKILLLSSSDIYGGAARSAYRLHEGFQRIQAQSQMLVQLKQSSDRQVIGLKSTSGIGQLVSGLRLTLDQAPLKLYPKRSNLKFSPQWFPDAVKSKLKKANPDIVNLHWVGNGYLQIESIASLNKPLVWTLHDMWPFTGGCHYSQDCAGYLDSCGSCPQLGSSRNRDLSKWIWQRKSKAWANLNLTVVCPSKWLASCAQQSSLFKHLRVEVIPYGLDLDKYRPINQEFARLAFNLPTDKKLILFGALDANDKRKGMHLLQPALLELSKLWWRSQIELAIFGTSLPENPPDFGFKTHYLGSLADDLSLSLAYSAADVFIAPSVQDNLPNTIMEAIACGVPCVGFEIGGIPDIIEHQKNGYLAQPYKIEDLAVGVAWVLENKARHQKLSQRAREKAEQEFALSTQAHRYLSVFESIQLT